MKRFLLAAAFSVVCTMGAFAQNQSITGKWQLISLHSDDVHFDVSNPDSMRAVLTRQFEATGTKADSAMVEMILTSMIESLGNMTFDFKPGGKLVMFMGQKGEKEEMYTVDYDKSLIVSKSETSSQDIYFKFEKENLVLTLKEPNDKNVMMTLKKLK